MTNDNRALRDVASYAPYEFIEILANAKTYGGGGIFNLYATVAIDSEWAPYVFVHEFGHHFEGNHLSDDYFHALTNLGARSTMLALKSPDLFKVLPAVVPFREGNA